MLTRLHLQLLCVPSQAIARSTPHWALVLSGRSPSAFPAEVLGKMSSAHFPWGHTPCDFSQQAIKTHPKGPSHSSVIYTGSSTLPEALPACSDLELEGAQYKTWRLNLSPPAVEGRVETRPLGQKTHSCTDICLVTHLCILNGLVRFIYHLCLKNDLRLLYKN